MLTICDRSALARWGERGLSERLGDPCEDPGEWSLPTRCGLNREELRAVRMRATPERPLHVLVSSRSGRVRLRDVVSHVWSTPLPTGALYQLSSGIYLASPEFCLQQMAPRRGVASVAALCMEVCGAYARSPWVGDGFRGRPPLSDPERLRTLRVVLTNGSVREAGQSLGTRVWFDARGALSRRFGLTAQPALVTLSEKAITVETPDLSGVNEESFSERRPDLGSAAVSDPRPEVRPENARRSSARRYGDVGAEGSFEGAGE